MNDKLNQQAAAAVLPTKRDETVLRAFSFTFYMTMALTVSFFPLYFSEQGYTKIQIGTIYSIGPLIGIVANLFWGVVSDKTQTVRRVLLVILSAQLVTTIILSQLDALVLVYITMMVFNFFHTPITALTDSLTMLTIRQSGKSYASFRVWGSFGFAFSALVCGFVLRSIGILHTVHLTIGTIALSLVLAFALRDRSGQRGGVRFAGMLHLLRQRQLLLFLLLILIMSFAHRANDGFLALHLRDLGASDTLIGWAWTASSLSEVPIFFYLSKYGHRYKELPLLMVAALCYMVRFALVSVVTDPVWIVPLQTMHSVSFGIFLVTALRYLQQLIPDDYRATGQAIFAVVWSCMAGLLSGVVGGWVFDVAGGVTLYRIAAVSACVAAVGFLVTVMTQNKKM